MTSRLALGIPGAPTGACPCGQSVSPRCGLRLDLAPKSLHRSLRPSHQFAQFCSGLGGHPVQALVLKGWKLAQKRPVSSVKVISV